VLSFETIHSHSDQPHSAANRYQLEDLEDLEDLESSERFPDRVTSQCVTV
jgi:hypothetical protein